MHIRREPRSVATPGTTWAHRAQGPEAGPGAHGPPWAHKGPRGAREGPQGVQDVRGSLHANSQLIPTAKCSFAPKFMIFGRILFADPVFQLYCVLATHRIVSWPHTHSVAWRQCGLAAVWLGHSHCGLATVWLGHSQCGLPTVPLCGNHTDSHSQGVRAVRADGWAAGEHVGSPDNRR